MKANDPKGSPIGIDEIAAARRLAAVEFTPGERSQIAKTIPELVEGHRKLLNVGRTPVPLQPT
jgi:hypothetical protein